MSEAVRRTARPHCEVGGGEAPTPPHLAAEELLAQYSTSFPSPDSSFDEDRPHSRLTIIESPTTDDYDYEDEFSQFSLDSPDPEDDFCDSPHGHGILRGSGSHTCEECFKKFSSPGKLRQHEYTHTGETPFECKIPDCDKKFTSKFKLKRHILIHSQTKTFLCDICHRAFRRKDHLRNHEKVHDPGKTIYTCDYDTCGRTYNSVTSFRKHQAMHSAEEGQLDCKICKMMLQSQEELMNHLKVHAGSRTMKGSLDKKFMCGQCDKKFFTRKDLKRHSVVHTGNREFVCPHCTQRFGRKDHMTRHAKKTHANFYDSSERLERVRLVSTPLPGEEEEDLAVLHRPSRKERSVSDPGLPPLPLLRELKASGTYCGLKIEPGDEVAPSQQKVIEEFEKLVTQDTLDLVKVEGEDLYPSPPTAEGPAGSHSASGCRFPFFQARAGGPAPVPGDTSDISKGLNGAVQNHRGDIVHAKIQPASSANEVLKFLIKEERNGLFDNNIGEDVRAFKELLAEKESMDFTSFMNEIGANEGPPIMLHSKRKIFLNPPSPHQAAQAEDGMLPRHLEDVLVKLEPRASSPGSPMDSQAPLQFEARARAIYLRTQSQDSLTRTKNPVLPSIHAEAALVVPEIRLSKYPVTCTPPLDFGEEKEDSLADLRGQLFLTEDYGQAIFQPWN